MALTEKERKTNKVCQNCGGKIRQFGSKDENVGKCVEQCCNRLTNLDLLPTKKEFMKEVSVFKNLDYGGFIKLVSVRKNGMTILLKNGDWIEIFSTMKSNENRISGYYHYKKGGHVYLEHVGRR